MAPKGQNTNQCLLGRLLDATSDPALCLTLSLDLEELPQLEVVTEEEMGRIHDVLFELFSRFGPPQNPFSSPHRAPSEPFDPSDGYQLDRLEERGLPRVV